MNEERDPLRDFEALLDRDQLIFCWPRSQFIGRDMERASYIIPITGPNTSANFLLIVDEGRHKGCFQLYALTDTPMRVPEVADFVVQRLIRERLEVGV